MFSFRFLIILLLLIEVIGPALAQNGRASAANLQASRQATERLRNAASQLSREGSAMYQFVETHYQISSRITELVAQEGVLDQPDYVARFNTELVRLFPLGQGNIPAHWQAAFSQCDAKEGALNSPVCAAAMAKAHIEGDFPAVFDKVGCGTAADWDRILQRAIRPAIAETIDYIKVTREQYGHAYGELMNLFSGLFTRYERNVQRKRAGCP